MSNDLGQFSYLEKALRILKRTLIAIAHISPYGKALTQFSILDGQTAKQVKSLTASKQQYWQKTEKTLKMFSGQKKKKKHKQHTQNKTTTKHTTHNCDCWFKIPFMAMLIAILIAMSELALLHEPQASLPINFKQGIYYRSKHGFGPKKYTQNTANSKQL